MSTLQLSPGMWQRIQEIGMGNTVHHIRKESDLKGIVLVLVFQPGMLNERGEEVQNMAKMLKRPLPYTVTIRDSTFSVS